MIEGVILIIACVCAIGAGIAFTIAGIWFLRLVIILTVDAYFYIVNRLV